MAKINSFSTVAPSLSDKILGTDVSDTTPDAAGETVVFTFSGVQSLLEQTINPLVDDTNYEVLAGVTNLQEFTQSVDDALVKARGTEVLSGGVPSINGGDNTAFDLTAVEGQIKTDAGYFPISVGAQTAVPITNIAASSTWVYYNTAGVLQQQTTAPTLTEFRQKLFLARFASNGSNLVAFEIERNPGGQYANSVRDLYTYLEAAGVPLRIGLNITGNANLTIARSAGSVFEFGSTTSTLEPNTPSYTALTPAPVFPLTRDSSISGQTNNIPVTQYDNAGTLTNITTNRYVAHRIYFFTSGNLSLQYGQAQYTSLADAEAGWQAEPYVLNPANKNGTLLGALIVRQGATDLSDPAQSKFIDFTIGGSFSGAVADALLGSNNLSDLANATTARSNLGVAIGTDVQAYDADTLKADTADTLTAGFDSSVFAAGTKSSGTFTPVIASGNYQTATNGGAHTLAPPANSGSMVIHYTNNGSAGAITTSGFTRVGGDTLTTTNGDQFLMYITRVGSVSSLNIEALQ